MKGNTINLPIPKEDIVYVKTLLKEANIYLPKSSENFILGDIFSKRIAKLEESFSGGRAIKLIKNVKINVSGVKKERYLDENRKLVFKDVPAEKIINITIAPIQFEDFELRGETLQFNLRVREDEWEDSKIIEQISLKDIKHIHNRNYKIVYPNKCIRDAEYWRSYFKSMKDEIKNSSTEDDLFIWTFNVLKSKSIYPLYGSDVAIARKIYNYCLEHFPKFASLTNNKKKELFYTSINKACFARKKEDGTIGRHILAKYIFVQLMKNNLISQYEDLKMEKMYIKEGGSDSRVDDIRYISYKMRNGRHKSYSPFSLWHAMAGYEGVV